MRVLAIDTSSSALGAAIVDEGGVAAEFGLASGRQHSEVLLPLLESLLAAVKLELTDMAALAVTIGPGSFTGLRIGLATVKAWAQVLALPVIPVSTLEALAYTAAEHGQLICPVLNARRGELYAALFEDGQRLWADMALAPAELAARLAEYARPVIFCGDGLNSEAQILRAVLGGNMREAPPPRRLFMAAAAGVLGREKLLAGETADAAALEPAYLRLSEAEEKRLAKQHGDQPHD